MSRTTRMATDLVHRLLLLSKNSDAVDTRLCMDISTVGHNAIDDILKCTGSAIRDNNKITFLGVNFGGDVLRSDQSLQDIAYFVANCSSLEILEIHADFYSSATIGKLLMAASCNAGIHALCLALGSDVVTDMPELCHFLRVCKGLKSLVVVGTMDTSSIVDASSGYMKTTEELVLGRAAAPCPSSSECISSTVNAWAGLSESKLKFLRLDEWCSSAKSLLLTSSCLKYIRLSGVDWRQLANTDSQAIDELLQGLGGSSSATKLTFKNCIFDIVALQKLLGALKSKAFPIRDLGFIGSCQGLQGGHLQELLESEHLEALDLEIASSFVDSNIAAVHRGLENSSSGLSRLSISTGSFGTLTHALTKAITHQSLNDLKLSQCVLSDACISGLVTLITRDGFNLQKLSFASCFLTTDGWTKIAEALKGGANFDRLSIETSNYVESQAIVRAMIRCFADIHGLKFLAMTLHPNVLSKMGDDLVQGSSMNWSLEEINVNGSGTCFVHFKWGGNNASSPFRGLLQFFGVRNKLKKLLSQQSIYGNGLCLDEWIGKVKTFSDLREGVSLTFWLFQQKPALFFCSC